MTISLSIQMDGQLGSLAPGQADIIPRWNWKTKQKQTLYSSLQNQEHSGMWEHWQNQAKSNVMQILRTTCCHVTVLFGKIQQS